MKKIIVGTLATFAVSVSLNAAVYATVNGEEVTDKDVANLMRAMPGAKFNQLQPEQQKRLLIKQQRENFYQKRHLNQEQKKILIILKH